MTYEINDLINEYKQYDQAETNIDDIEQEGEIQGNTEIENFQQNEDQLYIQAL